MNQDEQTFAQKLRLEQRRCTTAAERSAIVLLSADGYTASELAWMFDVDDKTIYRVVGGDVPISPGLGEHPAGDD